MPIGEQPIDFSFANFPAPASSLSTVHYQHGPMNRLYLLDRDPAAGLVVDWLQHITPSAFSSPPIRINKEVIQEVTARVLFAVVNWVKQIPAFSVLSSADQVSTIICILRDMNLDTIYPTQNVRCKRSVQNHERMASNGTDNLIFFFRILNVNY